MADHKPGEVDLNHSNATPSQEGTTMPALTTVPTSITLSTEQFEKLYLTPLRHRQPALTKTFGNPTPLALGGFVVTTTPLSCCLMAWRGAGGNGIAFTGPIIFLGGTLLVITSILEFILGNTFPCVVFGTIGGFWFAFGATQIPAFNAAGKQHPLHLPFRKRVTINSPIFHLNNQHNGRPPEPRIPQYIRYLMLPIPLNNLPSNKRPKKPAFLFIAMAILVTIYMICATRTNLVYVLIFAALILVFVCLAAAYWRLADGDVGVGSRLIVGAGAALFVASLLGFYLLVVQLFEALWFPVNLPVGDLSVFWGRVEGRDSERDVEMVGDVGEKS
ncbi:GPR1/FUN34/yaaH family-domain-containing protein [Aspergillus novoparasiticus]|uniref:GPR1/FUN34/yaaH family-domain-containing protein n=1 Tax=Aspergillus novoparasiticus TaxID=986946 RepID=A0A5N6F5K2_9EURO|nr:GPR1/FUN34/yaaH family-domain-containing protein [Aspergillus novoparasiticus]